MTVADLEHLDAKVAHPLTGPVSIKGTKPGDLLEIEYVDIIPQAAGWTRNRPGAGFLRDLFTEPYLAHWEMTDGWATSPQLPGVRIPNGSFMGTAGIAPSRAQLEAWMRREADLVERAGRNIGMFQHWSGSIGGRQRAPVDFPIRRPWESLQDDEGRGNHVCR